MRIWCWYCHKSVSTELPDGTIFRAIAVCPECIEASEESKNLRAELDEHNAMMTEVAQDVGDLDYTP